MRSERFLRSFLRSGAWQVPAGSGAQNLTFPLRTRFFSPKSEVQTIVRSGSRPTRSTLILQLRSMHCMYN